LRGIEECNYFHLFKKFKENETNWAILGSIKLNK
jgi:hypothetical protein